MRASDIVNAIRKKLPKLVDDFTSNVSIVSVVAGPFVGGVTIITVTTAAVHTLEPGNVAVLTGVFVPVPVVSFTRNGIIGMIETSVPHDLTNNSQPAASISGADQAEFNGAFRLHDVTNRQNFRVIMDDSGPTVATGILLGVDIGSPVNDISGEQEVTAVVSPTVFEYQVSIEVANQPVLQDSQVKSIPRITSDITIDRFIDAYTKQKRDNAWLVVVLDDAVANKSRREDTDATSNMQTAQYFNAKLNSLVNIYIVLPSSHSVNGAAERDRCEELLQPLCQCILLKKFDNLLSSETPNPLQIRGHGADRYDVAYYVHRYSFEAVVQMLRGDTAGVEEDVAFRNIDMTQKHTTGNEEMTALIDLDDQPLVDP